MPRPGRFNPRNEIRYPLYRRLGGPQGRSGPARKISSRTGIRSPDRPDSCESLNRLSYTGSPLCLIVLLLIIILMMQFSPASCYFPLPRPKRHLWLSNNTFHAHIKQAKLQFCISGISYPEIANGEDKVLFPLLKEERSEGQK